LEAAMKGEDGKETKTAYEKPVLVKHGKLIEVVSLFS